MDYGKYMETINDLFEPYAELESRVGHLMTQLFSSTCGMCTACCCRADICEEATESAFLLQLLERQGLDPAGMDERFGWLDLHGCSLEYGRPPVCYAYFCDELLARLPDEDARHAAKVLGNLIHHIGHKALGGWHLVEIMEEADLDMVDMESVSNKLAEARAALQVVESLLESGRFSAADREVLAAITTDEP